MQRLRFWGLLAFALALGLGRGWVDSRPTWDDTGITASAILIVTALFGAALPKYAWDWALAVGVWVPAFEIPPSGRYEALIALVIAFAGAYAGALGRRGIAALIRMCAG